MSKWFVIGIRVNRILILCSIIVLAFLHFQSSQKIALAGTDEPQGYVETAFYEITFSEVGGVPIRWDVLDARIGSGGNLRQAVIPADTGRVALIDNGLVELGFGRPLEVILHGGEDGTDLDINRLTYMITRVQDSDFEFVRFDTSVPESGLQVTKTYRVPREGFETKVRIALANNGQSDLSFNRDATGMGLVLGPGLVPSPARTDSGDEKENGLHTYTWPFLKFRRNVSSLYLTAKTTNDTVEGPIQWAGLHSHYFMMALVPDPQSLAGDGFARMFAKVDPRLVGEFVPEDELRYYPRIELYSSPFTIVPGDSVEFAYTLYAGPKDRKMLRAVGYGLEDIVFHHLWGWLAGLCLLIKWSLEVLYGLIGNWGLSIVVLGLVLRVLLFPLSRYGIKRQKASKGKHEELKPLIEGIKEKYKNDAVRKHEEILRLYKEHGLNPLAQLKGSLPLFVQLPILVALYQLLSNSYDIRGVTFLWINDLSLTDRLFPLGFTLPWLGAHFNLLPLIMFGAQVLIARSMVAEGAEKRSGQQKKSGGSVYLIPVIMLLLFYPFPAGCMLYWTVANISQLFEQRLIK